MTAAFGGAARRLSLDEWDAHYRRLHLAGLREPSYGGTLRRHVAKGGDLRLLKLKFDNSPAALRLWNFLLTEEDRLYQARAAGRKIVGAMKDLGTVPVLAHSFSNTLAFYPDGAWWAPCMLEMSHPGTAGSTDCQAVNDHKKDVRASCLAAAEQLGIGESFCPVRAMLGAFATGTQFPHPDLLICSSGATCDDFSAIAQRLESFISGAFEKTQREAGARGTQSILWWEIPARREPDPDEKTVVLPGGFRASAAQVAVVKAELRRICAALEQLAGQTANEELLRAGIRAANKVRRALAQLRRLVFTAPSAPLPALELLIAEMLAIHFCSDREESLEVLNELLAEVSARVQAGNFVRPDKAARIFWINPVADLAVMNLLEEAGGRLCGTEFMFCHALDEIPEDLPPLEALARMALATPWWAARKLARSGFVGICKLLARRRRSSPAFLALAIAPGRAKLSPVWFASDWDCQWRNSKSRRLVTL
jgi:hypothetical protein